MTGTMSPYPTVVRVMVLKYWKTAFSTTSERSERGGPSWLRLYGRNELHLFPHLFTRLQHAELLGELLGVDVRPLDAVSAAKNEVLP